MTGVAWLRVLTQIALRNIIMHKVTSLIVGSIIFFGTFLVVVGTALLDSIEASMARSITQSFVGDIQVSAADGRDPLELFGSSFMGLNDVGELREYATVEQAVSSVPNVRAVIPMGLQVAQIQGGNLIDDVLDRLRVAVTAHDQPRVDALAKRVRTIAADLAVSTQNRLEVSARTDELNGIVRDLAYIQSDAFWSALAVNAEPQLLYLDTHLAPLHEDAQLTYLRILGTDLDRFPQLFDRFKLVQGKAVPPHERGFIVSEYALDRFLKNRVAVSLDELKRERDERGKTIANDVALADIAKHLPEQVQRVTFALDAQKVDDVTTSLRERLKHDGDLSTLVHDLLTVDDSNLEAHVRIFYEVLAPHMTLYPFRIGDMVTLRAFTKSGYQKSVNVRVYGTFAFAGLESSQLAGATSLVDIVTFRDLYGSMTADKRQELAGIRTEVGLADVTRGDAESQLFGGDSSTVKNDNGRAFEELDIRSARRDADAARSQSFDPAEVVNGLALNAAVLLKDPTKNVETRAALEKVTRERNVPVKAIDWQAASGLVGQFVIVVRIVLYVAIAIIFLVALVIINNSMIMATVERVAEIGTMRAIGAQRLFVMTMFLIETLALGLIAGLLGLLAGAGLIAWLGVVGIPAPNDILAFLFSGPRLFPTVGADNLIGAFVTILAVSIASTLYPARMATRIQPVVAMQTKE